MNCAPHLSIMKLCASFHSHIWIQTGVKVRKGLSAVMTYVTLTFYLWPWPFAWTSHLSMVISHENFCIIPWQEHYEQGIQRTTTPLSPYISERIAHSLGNRFQTAIVSHWPITWPIYLQCIVVHGQSHCASKILSNSHHFHSEWVDPPNP